MGILGITLLLGHAASAQTILGTTGSHGVMGGGAVTVTGTGTTITGNLGVGSTFTNGGVAFGATGALKSIDAQNTTDFTKAFNGLAAMPGALNLTGMVLGTTPGAIILTPGVYKFTTPAALTGNLVLDAQGHGNAVWVFQMGSTFDTTANSTVTFAHTVSNSVASYGVFWQVSGATVFGASTLFEGNLLDGSTIGFGAGVQIAHGRALTATGTIDLAADTINFIAADSGYSGGLAFAPDGTTIIAVPEPATNAFIAALAALGLAFWRRRRAAN